MTTLRKLLYAGAFAATAIAAPAMAQNNTFNLGTIPAGQTSSLQSAHTNQGSFTDTITFTIPRSGNDGGIAYFNFMSPFTNIAGAMLNLAGPTSLSRTLTNNYSETLALLSGSYTATISGNANGTNGGSYSLGITAPTPEPEIWLSLAAGAGLAGFMARRRRKQAATAA